VNKCVCVLTGFLRGMGAGLVSRSETVQLPTRLLFQTIGMTEWLDPWGNCLAISAYHLKESGDGTTMRRRDVANPPTTLKLSDSRLLLN